MLLEVRPNGGDVNSDGAHDRRQMYVASFPYIQ
jgi:hypothetical protein